MALGMLQELNACACVLFIYFTALGMEPKTLWMSGKHSTTDLHSQDAFIFVDS
jgi:hypothetical protein